MPKITISPWLVKHVTPAVQKNESLIWSQVKIIPADHAARGPEQALVWEIYILLMDIYFNVRMRKLSNFYTRWVWPHCYLVSVA